MNKKDDLELFYILPYTKRYNSGYHYRNDDTGCTDYKAPSMSIWKGNSLFIEDKEKLLQWFYENPDNPIPVVYRIKYLSNYKGLDDIIKITNLSNNKTSYYTILNKDKYAWYDTEKSEYYGKDIWQWDFLNNSNQTINIKDIYEEICKRGIKIKCNVFKKNIDKTECFEFIGDPFYRAESEKMKNKKLILYRRHPNNFW